MMKRAAVITALIVGFALVFAGPAAAHDVQFMSIATGGTGGVYYPVGGGMAELINEHTDIDATSEVTGASVENVRFVQDLEVEWGLAQNDITYYAKYGEEMFEEDYMEDLRGIAMMYPETIQILTLEGSGVESVSDFEGKDVAVGAPGSGTEANARQIIEAHGLTYDDMTVDYLSFVEAVDALRDGHVDAAFVTAGIPTGSVVDLAATHDPKIVEVEDEAIEVLMEEYPYYIDTAIPGGTYEGIEEDADTVAVLAMIITNSELPEEFIYETTAAVFDNYEYLGEIHERGAEVTLETALDGMPIDLHEGARSYYEDKGIDVDEYVN